MKTSNMDMDGFIQYISGKQVYIYGVGDVFHKFIKRETYKDIHKSVAGYIDNGKAGENIEVLGQAYTVNPVDFLMTVRRGIVLLCGIRYMDEMYEILCRQKLSDDVECFILPLIWAVSGGQDVDTVKALINDNSVDVRKIEKKIHCFWFSSDRKPEEYQKCIDSWKRVCPDYEIMEWNAGNYDYEKNRFMKQAFECKKWAFVSDYARLDVIYHYGGIYLDMDVELLKTLDPLLKFKAFFNFGTQNDIDLGSGFGSVKGNPFVGTLLDLYKDREFTDKSGNPMTDKLIQPELIRGGFLKQGFCMNGSMQLVDDMLILPRKYYTPIDDFFLQNLVQCDDTRGIHHYHAGWWSEEWHEERKSRLRWIGLAENKVWDGV
ncbi:MAG: hypothetical protein K2I96_21525 [Lachnospiraceae bacterium]|nr:hypothetical protein [Lachnospiraceae bacterium]